MEEEISLSEFKERLSQYKKSDIILTSHAEIRALGRGIDLAEVKENLVNPSRLVYVGKQESRYQGEEKYDCYFAYSKNYSHKYVLALNRKVIIITIISINRDWQKAVKR